MIVKENKLYKLSRIFCDQYKGAAFIIISSSLRELFVYHSIVFKLTWSKNYFTNFE